MNAFEFPADVWGTVSDWVMILVTSITAYFLYNTLKSQKQVQQTQNRLLEIEQLKIKEAFKPELTYIKVNRNTRANSPDKKLIWIAVSNKSSNTAVNFEPIYEDNFKVIPRKLREIPTILKQGGNSAPIFFEIDFKEGEILNCDIGFSVQYEDVAGTRYQQKVHYSALGDDDSITTSEPEIIK